MYVLAAVCPTKSTMICKRIRRKHNRDDSKDNDHKQFQSKLALTGISNWSTSKAVRPLKTRSLSIPHDRHSGFRLPSLSVKNMWGLIRPISATQWGRGIQTSSPTLPPHSWNDITTWANIDSQIQNDFLGALKMQPHSTEKINYYHRREVKRQRFHKTKKTFQIVNSQN